MAKSPKALALGSALRTARQNKNITLRDFAGQLGIDFGMLSRWETGLRTPKPENVAQILTSLGVAGEQYHGIMTLVRDSTRDRWIATSPLECRQIGAAFHKIEQDSSLITSVCPLLIPGLLQIPEYIRAIMSNGEWPFEEIDKRVEKRIRRKEVLFRQIPAQLTVLLGEAALRQQIGGPAVHLDQLRYLLLVGRRANVQIHVVPFSACWNPLLDGAFHILAGATMDHTVFIESRQTVSILHKPEDVSHYRSAVRNSIKVALSAEDSMRFIGGLVHRMEQCVDHVAEVNP